MIVFSSLQIRRGVRVLLDNATTTINPGQKVGLVGKNGCGKSTLAKHFNAILLPESGKVYVEGMDTADEEMLYDIRQTVGMVFQNPDNQIVATVVEEDVAFALENLGVPQDEMRRRVDDSMKMAGIYEYRERAPHNLSGGQKQRVAIARALAMSPDILCFDEPTSALDPELTGEVLNVIRSLKTGNSTMIVVTHEMEFARHVADQVLFMADGVIAESGTPEDLFNHPKSPALQAFLSKAQNK